MPQPWLSLDEIHEIYDRGLKIGLHKKRDLMLLGLPMQYTAQLTDAGSEGDQLLADIGSMNQCPRIIGELVPLEVWLTNAAHHAAVYPEFREFFTKLSDKVALADHEDHGEVVTTEATISAGPTVVADVDLDTVNERQIFTNDLLPFGFLSRATVIGQSVCRLIVTRHENGQPSVSLTGRPRRYLGTGWLIGRSHVITNHHVVNARDPLETNASETDLKMQSEKTIVQFDFDSNDAAPDVHAVAELAHADRELDYAILKLAADSGRASIPLWPNEVSLPPQEVIPVNIIQHPGGAPKQIGMRNNLVARISDNSLAYFTDTKGGSSGSPVCNDAWQVVALHKAATRTFGELEFQGKKTEWVNIGTRIDRIISDLKANQGALWTEIGVSSS